MLQFVTISMKVRFSYKLSWGPQRDKTPTKPQKNKPNNKKTPTQQKTTNLCKASVNVKVQQAGPQSSSQKQSQQPQFQGFSIVQARRNVKYIGSRITFSFRIQFTNVESTVTGCFKACMAEVSSLADWCSEKLLPEIQSLLLVWCGVVFKLSLFCTTCKGNILSYFFCFVFSIESMLSWETMKIGKE